LSSDTPEQKARRRIDALLMEAGWIVQDKATLNLAAGAGVALREARTITGPADYLLFLGNQAVGIIEAKPAGTTLGGVEAQTRDYAAQGPEGTRLPSGESRRRREANPKLQVPVRPLPFLYESTGEETFFTHGLDPEPRARRVFQFHRPETLRTWIDAEIHRRQGRPGAPPAPTLIGRMRQAPPLNIAGLWPPQIAAIENLEKSVAQGRPRALIQMATGSGKTVTAVSAVYRLLKFGGARRVLFLVDRGNLGRQALKEFQAWRPPDDARTFTELYPTVNLSHNRLDPVNQVVITTIQRLYSILKGEPELVGDEESSAFESNPLLKEPPPVVYNPTIPPEFFDVVVIDECHRSIYSLWQQVLEYFDARLVGLTATPSGQTYGFFQKNVVSEYRHEQAVKDKVNVPFSVYEIRTVVGEKGATVVAGPDVVVGKRERATRATRWQVLDQDLTYAAPQLDRIVVVPDQIRTVLRCFRERLFTEIFPGRSEIPKTLIFAKSDDHAEDILRILRDDWALGNEAAVKITYKPEVAAATEGTEGKKKSASHKPEELISKFRTAYQPRIAVTVDLIATGTDIKALECVVFMRQVKSKLLFEQMKGRGVRVIEPTDFQQVTRDAKQKTHFVLVDCAGVMETCKSDPPLDRQRTVSFEKLLEAVKLGVRDEDVLATLAARLTRMDRRLTPDQQEELAGVGCSLSSLVAQIINAIDPDVEESWARAKFGLPPDVEPTDWQREEASTTLRDQAVAPLAYDVKLRDTLLAVRKAQDVTVDGVTIDEVTVARFRPELGDPEEIPAEIALVSAFETYCREKRDELDALVVLYSQPYARRLKRPELLELVKAIQKPPRQWTTEALWQAYEKLKGGAVRGASRGRMMTDLISLARHALGVESELVSYAEGVHQRFDAWISQPGQRVFTAEQRAWLELVRDRIVVDLEVRVEDFEETPFLERGGLGKAWGLFGGELEAVVAELHEAVVA
jgi:type I restriction enzyme R subunit